MKKVGIVTLYPNRNFGGILQAYALIRAIEQLGYDAEVIDYQRHDITYIASTQKIREREDHEGLLHYLIKSRVFYHFKKKQHMRFDEFERSYLPKSSRTYNTIEDFSEECVRKYDAFVCGSDQVWNPEMVGVDPVYFLGFNKDARKNIAYAPSIGIQSMDRHDGDHLAKLLPNIGVLSVREESGRETLHNLTGRNAKVVLDPTLVLDAAIWKELVAATDSRRMECDRYVLVYALGRQRNSLKIGRMVARKMKCKMVTIGHAPINCLIHPQNSVFDIGPLDFVRLFMNATFVVTNSFHGTIFSLHGNVPFYATERADPGEKSINSRITDLLHSLRLEGRKLSGEFDEEQITDTANIDWNRVNQYLGEMRSSSEGYLADALRHACALDGAEA